MPKKILFVFLFLNSLIVSAQQELGLHFLPNTIQTVKTNPAMIPTDQLVIGLPNGYFNLFHSSGAVNDFLEFDDNGPTKVSVSNWLNLVNPENLFQGSFELETISAFYRFNKLSINLNHAMKFHGRFNYPDTYVKLLGNGNAQFAGETVEFGPDLQANAYHEIGLGLAYELNPKITIGAKAKLLQGIGNVSTVDPQASIHTSDDIYQINVKSRYSINATNFLSLGNNGSFDLDLSSVSLDNVSSGNTGVAFDFGIVVKPIEELTIAASILDLGQIDWKKETQNFKSNTDKNYEGVVIDFPALLQGEEGDFSSIDTVDFENLFNFKETSTSYSTKLPRKLYLSANYQLNDMFRLGALYYSESFRDETDQAFAFNVTARISRIFTVGGTYSYRFEEANNIGLNTTIKVGPVQFFAATDNLISAVQPFDSEQVDARVGLNITFGKIGKLKEEIIEQ